MVQVLLCCFSCGIWMIGLWAFPVQLPNCNISEAALCTNPMMCDCIILQRQICFSVEKLEFAPTFELHHWRLLSATMVLILRTLSHATTTRTQNTIKKIKVMSFILCMNQIMEKLAVNTEKRTSVNAQHWEVNTLQMLLYPYKSILMAS